MELGVRCAKGSMGVQKGYPLSLILFGACIDRIEELKENETQAKGLQAPVLGYDVTMLLIYTNDVVLFTNGVVYLTVSCGCFTSIFPY